MSFEKFAWYPVGPLPEEGKIKKIKIGGKTICLINEGGTLYATGARCPHAGADLSQGWCKHGKLVCPLHRHQFDLSSGRGAPGQHNYIRVFPLQRTDGKLCVGIQYSWWKRMFS